MPQWLSDKIRFMSFLLMVMIVVLHANLMRYTNGLSHYIHEFITEGITRVAVPSFFLISGFLLMYKFNENIKSFFISKITSRIRTLLVPLVIWSLVGLGLAYLVETIDIIPYMMSSSPDFSIKSILTEIFINPTICFQLWFIRDLFIMVLFSPLFYYTIRLIRWGWIVIGLFLSIYIFHIGVVAFSSIYFFGTGMYISIYHKEWMSFRWNKHGLLLASIIAVFLGLCVLITIVPTSVIPLHMVKNILGAISIWGCYDFGRFNFSSSIAKTILSLSFFIYLFHLPLEGVIQKIFIHSLPLSSNSLYNCTYVLSILLTLFLSIAIGMYAKLKAPSVYKWLTGGR